MAPSESWVNVPPSETARGGNRSIDRFDEDSDDAVLLAAVVDGVDAAAALALLYDRHAEAVRKVCANQLRTDRESVDDLVQDVFVLLHRHAATITHPGQLLRWLRRTARNACLNHRKLARQHREVATADTPDRPDRAGDLAELLAHADQVERLLGLMDTKPAALLTAFYLRGLTLAEIADWLGSTAASVKTQMYQARREARRLVEAGKAMIPLPLVEWWNRGEQVLRAGGAPAVAAALVPLLTVGLLVPANGEERSDSAVQRAPAAAEAMPSPATSTTAQPAVEMTSTPVVAPSDVWNSAIPAGPVPTAGYEPPPPSALHTVVVPAVGTVQTYEQPEGPPDDQITIAPPVTGELVRVDSHDEPADDPVLEPLCAGTAGLEAVSCGPGER